MTTDRKLCDRCGKPLRDAGEMPTLELKSLGLYASDRMVLTGDKRSITVTSAIGSAVVPQSFAEVGSIPISFDQNSPFQPVALHRLPGRPINAYALFKDISVVARVTAGTLATPFALIGFLKYRDTSDKEHVVMPLGMGVPTALAPTDSSFRSQSAYTPAIMMSANQVGEAPVKNLGAWVIEGFLTLGTATTIVFDVYANIGLRYGVPNT